MNQDMQIKHISIEGRQSPIGIDCKTPVFHFIVESELNHKEITAYQIIVNEMSGDLAWDSSRCKFEGVPYITYAGDELKAKTGYHIKVRVWDEKDQVTNFSDPMYFETGLMDEPWEASWIEPCQEDAEKEDELKFFELFIPNPAFLEGAKKLKPCQNLRRSFNTVRPVKKARIYASAHGVYQLFMNGKKIDERRLAPETSVYEKILYYQTYDITEYLLNGENAIGVMLGDGWWIGRLGISGDSCNYGSRLGFIMQLEIMYEDGKVEIIHSDEGFKSKESWIRYSDLYIGEMQDLQLENAAWCDPDFDDSDWSAVQCVKDKKECLVGQFTEGIHVVEELSVQKMIPVSHETWILDFGQVISGVCRFEIEGKAGAIVTFEHSEVLDQEGNYKNNIIGRNKNQKDIVICRDGHQVFEPLFTYHGFRFVKVTGLSKEMMNVTALVIGTPLHKTGSFYCSDEDLNQLQHNIEWSTIGNMCSVPTDCPQREKLGWTGDIQVFARTGMFNFDMKNFLEAWLNNLRADQFENGEVPVTVPNHPYQDRLQRQMSKGKNSSSGWGDACVLLPYYLYAFYGDKNILVQNLNAMEKWLYYIKVQASQEPEGFEAWNIEAKERNPYLWNKGFHFGDWLIPSLRKLPNGVMLGTDITGQIVGSCFYAITVAAMVQIYKWFDMNEKVAEYETLLLKIQQAIRDEYVNSDGKVGSDTYQLQGLYVMILKAGAVVGLLKEKVAQRLIGLINENQGCLDTGFSSVSYLLDVLYDNGHESIAYQLLFQRKAPSWLYMVEQGATTIWENWTAITEEGHVTDSSYNHYAFGSVGDWIYRRIGGIIALEPGFKSVQISPDIRCGLTEARSSVLTPFGLLSVSWKWLKDELSFDIKVPMNIHCTLCIDGQERMLTSGSNNLVIKEIPKVS